MSVLTDTLHALTARYPEALAAWLLFCVLPLISCTIWTVLYRSQLDRPFKSLLHALSFSMGYPMALLGLIIAPISAFSIFLAPALLDGYPTWRSFLLALLAIPNWLTEQSFWLVPLTWLFWVVVSPRLALRHQKSEVK